MKTTSYVWAVLAVAGTACGKKTTGSDPAGSAPAAAAAPAPAPAAGGAASTTPTAAGGEVAGLQTVTDCPKSLTGSEKVARTITKACGPITVTGTYYLDGQLTLEAGVVLKFAEGAQLLVGENDTSKLIVKGTAPEPVVMTSAGDAVAGFWKGVALSEHAARSRIENLTIEHAGDDHGMLRIGAADVTVKGLTLRDGKEVGLYIDDNVKLAEISGAVFEKAGKTAVSLSTAAMPAFGPGGKFDADAIIEVRGGSVESDAKWQNPGAPFVIRHNVDVHGKSRIKLEIAAGTELRFDKDVEIDVGYSGTAGIAVAGTADKPVVLAAVDAAAPWRGIWLYGGADASIDFASFDNAGSDDSRGAVHVDDATLSLTNTSFKGKGLGLTVGTQGKLKTVDKTSFEGEKAVTLPADMVAALGSSNRFAPGARIEIKAGHVTTAATWVPQPVPFQVVSELLVEGRGVLTLQPGSDLVFAKDQQMSIGYNSEGALKAVGTPDKPIKLRGEHDEQDAWKGLVLYDNSRDSELANVRIEGAGAEAGVVVKDGATVKIAGLVCAKCTNGAVTSTCKAKLTASAVKAEAGTPKDVIKPENCQ